MQHLKNSPILKRSRKVCLMAIIAVALPNLLLSLDWQTEYVIYPVQFSPMTSRYHEVDSENRSHLLFGLGPLFYSWFDGVAWQRESVSDGGGSLSNVRLALDDENRPHVGYQETGPAGNRYTYAYRYETEWQYESFTTLSAGIVAFDVDSSGTPHICFRDSSNGMLTHGYGTASGWKYDAVTEMWQFGALDLCVDEEGYPHICYVASPNQLRYAYKDETGWHWNLITKNIFSPATELSMALDSFGNLHVTYFASGLRHSFMSENGWNHEIIAPEVFTDLSLDICMDNRALLSGARYTGELVCMIRDSTGWSDNVVDGVESDNTSMAADLLGEPRISYLRSLWYGGELRLASRSDDVWTVENIASSSSGGGLDCSIDISPDGDPFIAYRTGPWFFCAELHDDMAWQVDYIYSGSSTTSTSIAVDYLEQPHVAFSSPALRYAVRDQSGWDVDYLSGTTFTPCVKLDARDSPRMARISHQSSESTLRHHIRSGTSWTSEIIAFDELEWCSFAIDGLNRSIIAFDQDGVYYAVRHEEPFVTWTCEEVDGVASNEGSLALDPLGRPHIAYIDGVLGGLRYANKIGATWEIEQIEEAGSYCSFTSIAVDFCGYPYIVFYDELAMRPRMACRNGWGWLVEFIDYGDEVGKHISIIFQDSTLHAAYYDEAQNGLKYATANISPMVHLSSDLTDEALVLTWAPVPVAAEYWIYGAANRSYFSPDLGSHHSNRIEVLPQGITMWSSGAGIGDPNQQWTYLVLAVDQDAGELARSNHVAEWDQELLAPVFKGR